MSWIAAILVFDLLGLRSFLYPIYNTLWTTTVKTTDIYSTIVLYPDHVKIHSKSQQKEQFATLRRIDICSFFDFL